MSANWDCIVVGGGAAGLSATLVLGRARKRTLLVDAGHQCNLPAQGIGGLLGHDGAPPQELYAKGRHELARYPSVEVRDVEATSATQSLDGFEIELPGGVEIAKRILLTSGLSYGFPDVPGAAERWGRTVFHCPFCHGWEVRDRVLGVLDPEPGGATRAMLLRGWSDRVTLFRNEPAEPLDPADAERLREAGIAVDERRITELSGDDDNLAAIAFADGARAPCDGLLVAPTLSQRSQLAEDLGLRTTEDHPMVANAIEVDSAYCTSVENVFAAGDATGGMPSVANSIAGGSSAAAHIVHSLV